MFKIFNKTKPFVYSFNKTIKKILKDNVSVSRFGDGEFCIALNQMDVGFQKMNPLLSERLKEILKSDKENMLICIDESFSNHKYVDNFTPSAKDFWVGYLNGEGKKVYSLIDIDKKYYSSRITRPYLDYKNKKSSINKFNQLKKIWNKKNIIIIEGDKSRLGVGNDLFNNASTIERILCPSENSFDKYDQILQKSSSINKDKLILIALGPTASVLAYDLNNLGYQAIDVGHVDIEYECFLMNATEKVVIPNKYVNEVNHRNIESSTNKDYLDQIIFQIE